MGEEKGPKSTQCSPLSLKSKVIIRQNCRAPQTSCRHLGNCACSFLSKTYTNTTKHLLLESKARMSIDYQKAVIDLLATTEGRDKLYKGLSAAMRVVGERTGAAHHKAMASSVSEARCLLRVAGAVNNYQKIRSILKDGPLDAVNAGMIFRIAGDAVYCVHDNVNYIGKYALLSKATLDTVVHRSFVGMFWGFLAAVILDLHALITMDRSAPDFKEKWHARVLLLTRNFCDLLPALSNVKYLTSFVLTPAQMGGLGVVSALVSTYENWNKTIAAQLKKK